MPVTEMIAVCAITLTFLLVGMVGFACASMAVRNAVERRMLACFAWCLATFGCFDLVFLGVFYLWFDQCR